MYKYVYIYIYIFLQIFNISNALQSNPPQPGFKKTKELLQDTFFANDSHPYTFPLLSVHFKRCSIY